MLQRSEGPRAFCRLSRRVIPEDIESEVLCHMFDFLSDIADTYYSHHRRIELDEFT